MTGEKIIIKIKENPLVLTKKDDDYKLIFNKSIPIEVYYHVSLLRLEIEKKIKTKLKITTDDLEKDINNYFQLHLLRIVSSILIGKEKVSPIDLKDLDDSFILSISNEVIDNSIIFLKQLLIDQYVSKGETNLANISKNSKINTEINQNIKAILEEK